MYVYIYIYIYTEREREIDIWTCVYTGDHAPRGLGHDQRRQLAVAAAAAGRAKKQ